MAQLILKYIFQVWRCVQVVLIDPTGIIAVVIVVMVLGMNMSAMIVIIMYYVILNGLQKEPHLQRKKLCLMNQWRN